MALFQSVGIDKGDIPDLAKVSGPSVGSFISFATCVLFGGGRATMLPFCGWYATHNYTCSVFTPF